MVVGIKAKENGNPKGLSLGMIGNKGTQSFYWSIKAS